MRVGIEVGGTFTDLLSLDEAGQVRFVKVPSVPRRPDEGAYAALASAGIDAAAIHELVHGSTVATNAVLERRGARVAFVTTRGFRDILSIQRHDRHLVFELAYEKPPPIVAPCDCYEVTERILSDGSVETALDLDEADRSLIPALAAGGYEAVAICLLNAYANPAHERALTVAAAFGCVKAVLTSADIPYNAGSTRPATVTAPYGSLLNPRPPAAVRARMTATNRAFNAVMKALALAVPEKVIATGFDTTTGPYLSRRSEAGYKVYHEVIGGGYGASVRADGCSGVDGPLGNCSNVPVESLDMDFDFFRVREYSLIPDSGGDGAFRGGLGIRRRYEILADEVQYAQYGDRFRFRPDGLFGGEPGAAASCNIERDGEITELACKESAWLRSGDVLTVSTGGGGGYGAPDGRAAERIDDDAKQRRTTARRGSSFERPDAEIAR